MVIEQILQLDRLLFLLINSLPHNNLFDTVGLVVSFLGAFGLVWYILAAVIYLREPRRDRQFALTMILTGILSLFFVTFFFKPLIHRDRPTVVLGNQAIFIPGRYFLETFADTFAFPSGHTTIAFAAALVLSKKRPKALLWFYLLATIIAFTRIYLGRHFPLDVVAGTILGTAIGWFSNHVTLSRKANSRLGQARKA